MVLIGRSHALMERVITWVLGICDKSKYNYMLLNKQSLRVEVSRMRAGKPAMSGV